MKKIFLILAALIIILASCGPGRKGGDKSEGCSTDTTGSSDSAEIKTKPTVNVYIENSYSMDGYVKGETEFKETVFHYLGSIKRFGISDTLNLFYINRVILPQGTAIKDSNTVIMQDFVQKLNPTTFKNKGGKHEDRQESDIANIIKSVLSTTKKEGVYILVSDGIFSPGKQDAANFLSNQREGIAIAMDEKLDKEPNTAVIIYQLSSLFDGLYYNKTDVGKRIKEQRPYYIYVFGDIKYLSDLRKKVPNTDFIGGGVKNIFTASLGNNDVKFSINLGVGKHGNTKDKNTIVGLGKDKGGKVRFAINVDFSNLLLDDSYLLDSNNYENSSKYNLEIKPALKTTSNYTHTLYFSADKVYPKGFITVKLKAKRPAWVDEANDDSGLTSIAGKTYGIKYQIDGIYDAFIGISKYYAEINIEIK